MLYSTGIIGGWLIQAGKLYDHVAIPILRGEINTAIGGAAVFWQQFASSNLGMMLPKEWMNIVSEFFGQAELMRPEPWNNIIAM